MPHATVWLNKGLSSNFDAVESLRSAQSPGELRVLSSHPDPDCPAFRVSNHFEVEPKGLSEAAYLDYCLDFAQRHSVDAFIPGKNLRAIMRERSRFDAAGVRLVAAADADTLDLLEDKAAVYTALGAGLVALPEYEVVRDLAGFDAAYARLRVRHKRVCFKPAVSVFGLGFKVISETGSAQDRLFRGEPLKIGLGEARRCLGERAHFRDLLVMQYLPGPERSIDCLAQRGSLIRCVVRLKSNVPDGPQLLEANPALEAMVGRLTERLRLDGLFNVQFRDCDGVPYLLEINPRMSGGLLYACMSGLAFPYWAVRVALGTATPDQVPRPRTGLRVSKVNRAILL
ncbi:MAG: ATP-grasp domain-containing protein [Gemmataceae bacterium]|nr:ATP-grasp domain-containing protein [Gemmataceae bacterium]